MVSVDTNVKYKARSSGTFRWAMVLPSPELSLAMSNFIELHHAVSEVHVKYADGKTFILSTLCKEC